MTTRSKIVFLVLLLVASVHCGGVGAAVGDLYEDAAVPDQMVKVAPDAAAPEVVVLPLVPDAGEDAADGDSGSCFAPVVSLAQGTFCGPQGAGTVCGVFGTVYVCRGAYRPPIEGCVLFTQSATHTRTLCPEDLWVPVEDPTKLCIISFPLRFHAPANGGTPPGPTVAGPCVAANNWTIDGVSGKAYCCSMP